MKILVLILVLLFGLALYALMTAASKADDEAENIRNSEEEK